MFTEEGNPKGIDQLSALRGISGITTNSLGPEDSSLLPQIIKMNLDTKPGKPSDILDAIKKSGIRLTPTDVLAAIHIYDNWEQALEIFDQFYGQGLNPEEISLSLNRSATGYGIMMHLQRLRYIFMALAGILNQSHGSLTDAQGVAYGQPPKPRRKHRQGFVIPDSIPEPPISQTHILPEVPPQPETAALPSLPLVEETALPKPNAFEPDPHNEEEVVEAISQLSYGGIVIMVERHNQGVIEAAKILVAGKNKQAVVMFLRERADLAKKPDERQKYLSLAATIEKIFKEDEDPNIRAFPLANANESVIIINGDGVLFTDNPLKGLTRATLNFVLRESGSSENADLLLNPSEY